MKVFNRRNVLKGGLVGSMAAGFASFVGASHAAEPAAKAPAQNDKNTYDVIVLGAGPAGLVTAIAAKQAGAKKVVVFEKRDRPDGNAIFALGSVCGWGSRHQKEQGIKDTADDFYAMMMDVSKQMGDKALNRTYTDNISAGIDWLGKDIGVKFGKIRPMPYPRLGRTCRVDGEGLTGGAQLVKKLLAAAAKEGVEVKFEHKGIELLHDDKMRVTGVKIQTPAGQEEYFSKGGVAIATGGFSANPEMVDKYIGGAEHACMHLLYARFFTKALRDMGYLDFDEPFKSLVHQGTILGPDGQKMSKSRGNVISPDTLIEKYGSDAFRLYLMFGFSYVEGGPWNDKGLESIQRFMDRVERLVCHSRTFSYNNNPLTAAEKNIEYVRNNTIKCVTADTENFAFNTAIARIMEFTNALTDYENKVSDKNAVFKECVEDLVKVLAPFAPHFTEELWEILGNKTTIFNTEFPKVNEKALIKDELELAVQINSRVKAKIVVPSGADKDEIQKIAMDSDEVKALLDGATVKKVIVIPHRLINFVI